MTTELHDLCDGLEHCPNPQACSVCHEDPERDCKVTWEIDLPMMSSPRDAAEMALRAILEGDMARIFTVTDGTHTFTVDLSPDPDVDLTDAPEVWP